ncbi:MAG: GTPase Era [Lautropia sp.]
MPDRTGGQPGGRPGKPAGKPAGERAGEPPVDGGAFRSGRVAIVGRPNTGKSTLLNRLVGQKLSITADRPQTTRHRVLGVITRPDAQIALLDSPGYQTLRRNPLNQLLNRTVQATAQDVDAIVLVIQSSGWSSGDQQVRELLPPATPLVIALNKCDLLARYDNALPRIAAVDRAAPGAAAIVPISARTGAGVDRLLDALVPLLPVAPATYDAETVTDRPERFFAAELIREKLFRLLGDELPYQCTVVIDRFELDGDLRRIAATIVVERRAHKPMVLGRGGERIKRIASEARADMERLFDAKVFLTLWVQVRGGWSQDAAHLRSYGYE